MRWAFFVDANLEPDVARFLQQEGYRADYADYILDEDADDEADILLYVREEELIVITADVKNFAAFDESRHEGVFFLNHQRGLRRGGSADLVLAPLRTDRTPRRSESQR